MSHENGTKVQSMCRNSGQCNGNIQQQDYGYLVLLWNRFWGATKFGILDGREIDYGSVEETSDISDKLTRKN